MSMKSQALLHTGLSLGPDFSEPIGRALPAAETPFEDAVSRSCTMGTLAHCWDFCFEPKLGSLCSSVFEMGGVRSWAGALHAQGASYVPSDFDHLEIHSSYSKWGLGCNPSTLTWGSGQLA